MWQIFRRMLHKWYCFLEKTFHLTCEVSWLEIRKILKFEKLENMMERQNFLKKTLSSFKKAFLPKWESAKYAGSSRQSCFVCNQFGKNGGKYLDLDEHDRNFDN